MVRIFVYGTLKRGGCRSDVLQGQRFVADATTTPNYRLYNAGSYPALIECEEGVQVAGEIWEISDECLRALDAIEHVPHLYDRKPVRLNGFPSGNVETYIYQRSVAGMRDCGENWNSLDEASDM